MTIYFFIIFIVLIISFFSVDKRINSDYHFFFGLFFTITLGIIAGTRLVGYDFSTYLQHFNRVPDLFDYQRTDISIEVGYEMIVSILKTLNASFNVFLICYATITLIFIFYLSFKYSPIPLLTIAMFFSYSFFFQVMGQMRQPFAILFLYTALIPLVLKKKYLLSCLIIIISTICFHKSSIFCFAVFLLSDRVLKYRHFIFCTIIAIGFYIFSTQIMKGMLLFIPKSFPLYGALEAYTTYKSTSFSFSLGMIERIGMFLVLLYFANKHKLYQTNQKLRLFINIYFTGICIYFSFISVAAEFATRGTFFFVYSLFFAMPILISKVPLKSKYILYLITILWCTYLSSGIIRDPSKNEEYIPYDSTLFQTK